MTLVLNSAPVARQPFYCLLFASRVRMDVWQAALMEAFLTRLVNSNLAAGLTGVLVFSDVRFVQTLEGERAHVQTLFERIRQDRRHCDVALLAAQFSAARRFKTFGSHYVGVDEGLRRQFGGAQAANPMLEFMVDVACEGA